MRGRVAQKPNGRWFYVVDVGQTPDGKRDQEQRTFETEAEAFAALARRNQELADGVTVRERADTLAVYLREWVRDPLLEIEDGTRWQYRGRIERHIIPHLGSVRVRALRPKDIRDWHRALKRAGLAASTIANVHGTLSSALSSLVRDEELVRNVAALVPAPAVPAKEARYWTPEQARQFVRAVAGDHWAAPCLVMLRTGLRSGECLALRWDDLDLQDGWLSVRATLTTGATGKRTLGKRPKTPASARRITIDPETVAEFNRHRDRQRFSGYESPLVFPGHVLGMPIAAPTLGYRFGVLCERAGLGGTIPPHGLRHTHATMLLYAGVDIKTVSRRLGHKSVAITLDLYGHVLDEMQERAASAVLDMLHVSG